jgi:hypothetical protein
MINIDQNGEVFIEDSAKKHPVIIALKEETKEEFEKFLIYAFHTYHKKSVFRNQEPFEKRKRVCITFLHGYDSEYFEKSLSFQAFINELNDTQYTTTEKELNSLLFQDIPQLRDHLMKISFFKDEKIQIDQEVEIEVEHKKKVYVVTIPVSKKINIRVDNSKEKRAALDNAEFLFNMEKRLRLLIEQESVSLSSRRKFDIKK